MPTYEYECEKCGYKFERLQYMTEPPIKTCPLCEGPVKRLFGTGAGIIFKGSGFYQTDYRSENYKRAAEKEKSEEKSEKKDSESTSKKSEKKDKKED